MYETEFTVRQLGEGQFKQELSEFAFNLLKERIASFKKKDSNTLHDNIWRSLEINIGNYCNLQCKYCYINRYNDKLYPMHSLKGDTALRNLNILLNWLYDQQCVPRNIEIFGGDVFSSQYGFGVLNTLLEFFKGKELKPAEISIPANGTFILDDRKTQKVEKMIGDFAENNIILQISLSIDGKYMEEINRPFKPIFHKQRDDVFFEKAFKFAQKHGFGFHPMVYSNNIEHWPENFVWFVQNYYKHGIPLTHLYLLAVRNYEWTQSQIIDLGRFVRFLAQFTYRVMQNGDKEKFVQLILRPHTQFNILNGPFSTCQRGVGCSLQTSLMVNIADLSLQPCHRTNYEHTRIGKFIVENDSIVGFEADNPEFYVALSSFNTRSQPLCEMCIFKFLCSGICPGSQLETTGHVFIPFPSQCQMKQVEIQSIVYTLYEIGVLYDLMQQLTNEKVQSLLSVLQLTLENKKFIEQLCAKDQYFDKLTQSVQTSKGVVL